MKAWFIQIGRGCRSLGDESCKEAEGTLQKHLCVCREGRERDGHADAEPARPVGEDGALACPRQVHVHGVGPCSSRSCKQLLGANPRIPSASPLCSLWRLGPRGRVPRHSPLRRLCPQGVLSAGTGAGGREASDGLGSDSPTLEALTGGDDDTFPGRSEPACPPASGHPPTPRRGGRVLTPHELASSSRPGVRSASGGLGFLTLFPTCWCVESLVC